jgi:hypothetical protein
LESYVDIFLRDLLTGFLIGLILRAIPGERLDEYFFGSGYSEAAILRAFRLQGL